MSRHLLVPRPAIVFCALFAAGGPVLAQGEFQGDGVQDRTLVEQAIARQNPCGGLSTEVAGATIGLDELRDVAVNAFDLSLRGDDLTMVLSGMIACGTSNGGLLAGDASATIRAEATVDLAACDIRALSVTLDDFGGTYGPILAGLQNQIEDALTSQTAQALVDRCERLMAQDDVAGGPGITLQGTITDGVECLVITTRDGQVYALTGDIAFVSGQEVEITGEPAEMSFCMQGEGTIEVTSVTPL